MFINMDIIYIRCIIKIISNLWVALITTLFINFPISLNGFKMAISATHFFAFFIHVVFKNFPIYLLGFFNMVVTEGAIRNRFFILRIDRLPNILCLTEGILLPKRRRRKG